MLRAELFKDVPIREFPEKADPRSYKVSFGRFRKATGFSVKEELVGGVGEVAERIRADGYGDPRDDQYFRVKYLLEKGMENLSRQ